MSIPTHLDLSGLNIRSIRPWPKDIILTNTYTMTASVALDLSGVNVTHLNTQFLHVLTELLQNKPQTAVEALALYHSVTVQLSAYLVSNLPALEQKAATVAMWAVQEVESGNCTSLWCVPK